MTYITFAIPSYNSEDYIDKAIESLLLVKDYAEIIIINDGSTDSTLEISNRYKTKYPKTVRVIDKENGGHGSGVNAGLEAAKGLYYKVVDSDDWLDHENIHYLIDLIKKHQENKTLPDMYVFDFVYEHFKTDSNYIRNYSDNFPENKLFTWKDVKKKFRYSKTMLMHAQIFKTSVLKESLVKLPHHTFYVDNIFAYTPLPFVKSIYYVPKVLYHYFIGRDDQSIEFHNIVERYYQQINVMKFIVDEYSYDEIKKMDKGLKIYMKHFLSAIMIITQMFTTAEYSDERKEKLNGLWKHIKETDKKMYNFLRFKSYNTWVNFLPWKLKGYFMKKGYFYLAKKVKLG